MRKSSANGHSRSIAKLHTNLNGVVSGAGAVINDTFHSVVDAEWAEISSRSSRIPGCRLKHR